MSAASKTSTGIRTITIVASNFSPETNPAAKRYSAIAAAFTAAGWFVQVIAPLPHYPQMKIYEGYERLGNSLDKQLGISVHRINPVLLARRSLVARFLAEFVYSIRASYRLFRHPTEVVIAACPYMMIGPLVYVAAFGRKAFMVLDVRDLTWQYISAVSASSFQKLAGRLLEKLMLFTARKANLLVAATEGQREYFARHGVKRIALVPNGVTKAFLQELDEACRRVILSGDGKVTVTYAGLLGMPQALKVLIEVARIMPDVQFRLVGDGVEKSLLEQSAIGLDNVHFTGYVNWDKLKSIYDDTDILVAHLRNDPAFDIAQPSKLWEYMASGRPVVYGGQGEAAKIIVNNGIGVAVPPESAVELSAAIRRLIDNPDEARKIGNAGKRFVSMHRERDTILTGFVQQMNDAH